MSIQVRIKKYLGDFGLDIDISSQSGMLGLLGESGSGKSMTLRCLAGIERPDEGYIAVNGRVLYDSDKRICISPQKRRVGYLFQSYALFPHMTVWQNISCGLRGGTNNIQEVIERMHLVGLERRYPHQLSGGQQQRTALARILIGHPEVILLDEPLSALDSYLREQMQKELSQIVKSLEIDTILVTHNRSEVYELSNTLAIIDQGKILEAGPVKRLFEKTATKAGAVLTGCKNIVSAVKVNAHRVFVPDWQVTLETKDEVGDNVCAVGIRAHYFRPKADQNCFPVQIEEVIEEPFEWTLRFRYQNQSKRSEAIWWRFAKEGNIMHDDVSALGVAPKDVMLLYQ